MLIDGLNGGSTDPSHKGWFEISSLDFDLEKATSWLRNRRRWHRQTEFRP